jgi:ATP-dependent helicase/nuclease subunit A
MAPSPEQQEPVLHRGGDVVVTAGAGTGKTRTLVARFLSLLAEGLPLRSITAITFTLKASREMRNRLREEVRRYLERSDLAAGERNRWEAIYTSLDAARVSTIHSLCADLLRFHPAELNLDPGFEMLEEGEAAVLRAQVVDSALSWAADQPGAAALFSAFGAWQLRRMVGSLLDRRLEVEETAHLEPEEIWAVWEQALTEPVKAFLEDPEVQRGFRALVGLREAGLIDRAEQAGDSLVDDLKEVLVHWDAVQSAREEKDWGKALGHLGPLRGALKQKGRKANWEPAEPKQIIKELQGHYDRILAVYQTDDFDLALDRQLALEVLPLLLDVVGKAAAEYRRIKRRRRALDFDDLEAKALQLLREFPEVRSYWQGVIQALLVDEFQDTNARQRDLLELLNGPGNRLFIVGDGKQSIYRFRGADVAVFREEKERIQQEGRGYQLATSYRAHPRLLRLLNALLEPILGEEDPDRPFQEPFAPLEPARSQPASGFSPPYVEFHLTVGSRSEGALNQAAEAAAARIQQLVEAQPAGSAQDQPGLDQPPDPALLYGDVAVLCRASSSFAAYERAFEARGIPYLTISGRGFYDRPEVRDVLNFLTAAAEPWDDLALAGSLRSPAGGLSDLALYRLRQVQREREAATLWEVLNSDDLAFLEQETEAAVRGRELLKQLGRQIGRETVAVVLKDFLSGSQYRAGLGRAGLNRSVDNLNKLLADAQTSGMVSLPKFLEYIQQLRDVAVREGEAPAVAEGAVQLMTVHQAKGLEFPVVVIGDVSKRPPRPRGVIVDKKFGVVPPFSAEKLVEGPGGEREKLEIQSAAYRAAREHEKARDAAESARLLYVAATRAREKLLISGCLRGINKDGTFSKPRGWLGELGKPLGLGSTPVDFQWNGTGTQDLAWELRGEPILGRIYQPGWTAGVNPADLAERDELLPPRDPALLESLVQYLPGEEDEEEAQDYQLWRVVPEETYHGVVPTLLGELFHRAVQRGMYPEAAERDFHRWAGAALRRKGLINETQIQRTIAETVRLLGRLRRWEGFQDLEAADIDRREIPFSYRVGDKLETGRIDVLYRLDGTWTVLEYKTDSIQSQEELQEKIREYQPQVRKYLEAVEGVVGARPSGWIVFLDVEGELQAHRVDEQA